MKTNDAADQRLTTIHVIAPNNTLVSMMFFRA